jgi:hypothetical protein
MRPIACGCHVRPALIIVDPEHSTGFRIDQVQPRANCAGDGFDWPAAMLSLYQAGQADKPVQFARVKLTCPLGTLAAISNASSETSKVRVSSCVYSGLSVIAFGVMGISPSLGLDLIDRASARSFRWVARVYVVVAD